MRTTTRREELAAAATDYVLAHGLVGLSLRPMAAAIGTSDRMLLYHFRDKDDLVATVLRVSNDRSVNGIRGLSPSPGVRRAVLDLWRAVTAPAQAECQRMYVEAAALGLLGTEPYASVVREANASWVSALADHLVGSGAAPAPARRAVVLIDAAFMGFHLDQPLEDARSRRRAVGDLADAVAALVAQSTPTKA